MSARASSFRTPLHFGFLSLLLLIVGCGGSSHSTTTGSIQISGGSGSLAAGGTMQLTAIETDGFGKTSNVTSSAVWTSGNSGVAAVDSSGVVTGIKAGDASITANVSKITGSFGVTIGAPAVTLLALSPSNATVTTRGTQKYSVTATYANNTSGTLTSGVQWSVLPASVATITTSGVVTAVAPGSYVVVASVGTVNTTASGTVVAPALSTIAITPANASIASGKTQQFKATGTYSNGTTADLTTSVAWTSSNTSLLTISANGLATASTSTSSTAVTVTAQLGSTTASVTAHVTPTATLLSLYVVPTSSSIVVGSAEPHQALAYYSDGTQKDVSDDVAWTVASGSNSHPIGGEFRKSSAARPEDSSDNSVTVTQTGTDTAVTPGTSTVEANLGGVQSGSTVIVTNATVTKLEIHATKALFPAGAMQPVQLIGTFSDGSSQDLSLTANWQSSDNTVATIDNTGDATGLKAGPVTFTASFGGLTASTIGFQVLPTTLVSTVINVDYPTNDIGLREQLQLLGTYSDGTIHDLTSLATWQSNDPSIVSVDSDGVSLNLTEGTTQVIGTVFGFSAITSLTAVNNALLAIDVEPADGDGSLALGTTLDILAVGHFPQGTANVTSSAIWASSNPAVLTIDGTGRIKGGSIGQTTVSATLLGITQLSKSIIVSGAKIAYLSITPTTAQVAALTGHQYTATGYFNDGSVQDLTPDLIWNTSDNTIASIDTNGFAIGMKPGIVQVSGSFQGLTVTAPLTVTNATLLSVAVSPVNSELPLTVIKQFSLIGTFSDGTTQDLSSDAVWSTPTPATIFEFLKGRVGGLQTGVGVVAAQRGSFSASTNINVTNATLKSLALTPASTTIREAQQQQMTLIGTFSDGYRRGHDHRRNACICCDHSQQP